MIEIFVIVLVALLALPVSIRLTPGASGERHLGQAILIGCGLASLALYAVTLVAIPWSFTAIVVVLVMTGASAAWGLRSRRLLSSGTSVGAVAGVERVAALACDALTALFLSAYAIYATLSKPWQWDYWSIWGLKGKAFFVARSVDWGLLSDRWASYAHPDYPPGLPLLYDVVALARGRWDDRWLGLLFVAFAVATVLAVRGLVREETRSTLVASLVGLAVTGAVMSRWVGTGELPLIAFGTCGVLLVRKGLREPDPRSVRLGVLFVGFAGFVKNEGVALVVAVALATLVATRSVRAVAKLWPALAIAASWQLVRIPSGLTTDLFTGSFASRVVDHLASPGVFVDYLRRVPFSHALLWPVLAIVLVAGLRIVTARERFLALTIFFEALAIAAAFLVTPRDLAWHLNTAGARTMNQLTPLLVVLASLVLVEMLRKDAPSQSTDD